MPAGIVTRNVRFRSRRPSPWQVGQERLDDLALAPAARAGADVDHLAEHRLADGADLAAALALGARGRLGPGAAPLPEHVSQRTSDRELDLLLGALDRLLERDAQVVAQVRAGCGRPRLAVPEAAPPKNASKMSLKPPKPSKPAPAGPPSTPARPNVS